MGETEMDTTIARREELSDGVVRITLKRGDDRRFPTWLPGLTSIWCWKPISSVSTRCVATQKTARPSKSRSSANRAAEADQRMYTTSCSPAIPSGFAGPAITFH